MFKILFVAVQILITFFFYPPRPLYAQPPFHNLLSKDTPKQYYIKTDDGWLLSLYRYAPRRLNRKRPPVILCHGFNYNSYIWDLEKKHSLARYLRNRGFDVWAVNLRGSGDSSKPALSDLRALAKLQIEKMPRILLRAPQNIGKFDWTIDDHIFKDLPAIINFVKSESKSRQVVWVGHSMGAMVICAYLASRNSQDIKNVVAIGSMINVKQPPDRLLELIASQKPIIYASLLVNTTVAYQLRNITLGAVKLPWEELFYNKENMDDITVMRMFRAAIDDTSPGVIAQFSDMIKSGSFMSVDKKTNYTKNIFRIRVPILFLAGAKDRMATAETAQYAYDRVSSTDKELRILSKANGYSADYGHCDLILGKKSQKEVYSYIYNWLKRR